MSIPHEAHEAARVQSFPEARTRFSKDCQSCTTVGPVSSKCAYNSLRCFYVDYYSRYSRKSEKY